MGRGGGGRRGSAGRGQIGHVFGSVGRGGWAESAVVGESPSFAARP